MNRNSIRLISDINPEDVLADNTAAIRVDNFQVLVVRIDGGIQVGVFNNGIPFHLKSVVIDDGDVVNINFLEGK